MSEYNMEDDAPSINEPIVMDDVSTQTDDDAIDPAKKVKFTIAGAKIRTALKDNDKKQGPDNPWKVHRLALDAVITDGIEVEGETKYANKHIFDDLVIAFNQKAFPSEFTKAPKSTTRDYWEKRARASIRGLLESLGYDPKEPPTVDAQFLEDLKGREFMADISKREIKDQDESGAYSIKTGRYRNELRNFRSLSNGAEE